MHRVLGAYQLPVDDGFVDRNAFSLDAVSWLRWFAAAALLTGVPGAVATWAVARQGRRPPARASRRLLVGLAAFALAAPLGALAAALVGTVELVQASQG